MGYLNRVWMAASVAVVQGHPDQGQKLKSGIQSLQQGRRRLFSGGELRPMSSAMGAFGGREADEIARRNDETIRNVMYLNCWGQG